MSRIFLDFTVSPGFNKTADVDFGPGTTHPIRYSIADYKAMLREDVDAVVSPLNLNYTVTIGASTFASDAFAVTNGTLSISGSGQFIFDDSGTDTDYPSCPFADGVGDPHEDADVHITGTMVATMSLSLKNPRTEQASWHATTHVWLPFTLDIPALSRNEAFVCTPSGESGDGPLDTIPSDFVGIDYAGAGIGDTSIPLGDGTTHAFFNTLVGDRITTTTLVTTNI